MSRRQAILEGAMAAARLHDQLDVRHAVESSGGSIDVFGALLVLKAALIFRPLDGLLGFCIRGADRPGVVISTQRPLRIQRFTGAHELGHVYLGHTESLDGEEILTRGGPMTNELEIAANSCAFRRRRTAGPVMADNIGAKRRKQVDYSTDCPPRFKAG